MPEILRKLPEHLLLIHALRERERKREREREERERVLIWLFEYFFLDIWDDWKENSDLRWRKRETERHRYTSERENYINFIIHALFE